MGRKQNVCTSTANPLAGILCTILHKLIQLIFNKTWVELEKYWTKYVDLRSIGSTQEICKPHSRNSLGTLRTRSWTYISSLVMILGIIAEIKLYILFLWICSVFQGNNSEYQNSFDKFCSYRSQDDLVKIGLNTEKEKSMIEECWTCRESSNAWGLSIRHMD